MNKYIIALDQGTTSSRAVLFNYEAEIVAMEQQEITQIFPRPGWVEHDPLEIWDTQCTVAKKLLAKTNISPAEITAVGITNQRETVVVWEKQSGLPLGNAIVWQDKRTADYCETLKKKGLSDTVRRKTGLVIDAYFSATKVKWMLDHIEGARKKAEAGELLMGTIDTWLIWNMTNGKHHVTDYTNASRTLIYNIVDKVWDEKLLREFGIPASMLPEVKPSSYHFGDWELNGMQLPIMGVAGDQQAALFGQACVEEGMAKNTYGTGCFMLMNIGTKPIISENNLLTTMACSLGTESVYALEGSIFIAGAVVQWLRDAMKLITQASETEQIAQSVTSDEVVVVPAFAGLGVPYWDAYSRGAIFGLTRDTGREHVIKAALDAIALQTKDVFNAIVQDTGIKISTLRVDGGACANDYLMQYQANLLDTRVDRPEILESTALGAAFLAGIKAGVWTLETIKIKRKTEKLFTPTMAAHERERIYRRWKKAVHRTLRWQLD